MRMMRRASQMAIGAHLIVRRSKAPSAGLLCLMTSGFPNIPQPSSDRRVRSAQLSSVIVLFDCSIAIDPIKYIRIPLSFDDFQPDSSVIDNDGMPGKPSPPTGSVFGSYSHFMILHLVRG